MAVQDINVGSLIHTGREAGRWRYWLSPAMAAMDVLVVFAIVFAASVIYHSAVYGGFGNFAVTTELATLLAAIFLFTNLMQGRYRLANYILTDGQMMQAFRVWNMTMIAFIAIAFMAKVIDNYSRAVVLVTYVVGIPMIALARHGLARALARASRSGRIATERVMLVGHEDDILNFATRYRPWNIGFVVVDAAFIRPAQPDVPPEARDAALAADLADAQARVRRLQPDSVFVALPWS
jgi:FlaA1/EpsC-like NDP-sugar epimerase